MNPINLFFRFFLELAALISAGLWAYQQFNGWISILLSILTPLILMLIWGVFAVPNDPSRSGKTVISTKGWIRLTIEFLIFGFSAYALIDMGKKEMGWIFIVLIIFHYIFSYDRIKWLLLKTR